MWAGTPYSPDEDVGRDKNTVAQYFCTAWEIHLQQIIWELLCKDIISQRDLKSMNNDGTTIANHALNHSE